MVKLTSMTILLVKGGKRMKGKWILNIGAFLLVGSLLAGCGTTTDDDIINEREGDAPLEENERDTNRNDDETDRDMNENGGQDQNENGRDNNQDDNMEDNMESDTEEDLNNDRG